MNKLRVETSLNASQIYIFADHDSHQQPEGQPKASVAKQIVPHLHLSIVADIIDMYIDG